MQALYQATEEPAAVDGALNIKDGTRDLPPQMISNRECYRVLLNALADLVCVEEMNMGSKATERTDSNRIIPVYIHTHPLLHCNYWYRCPCT